MEKPAGFWIRAAASIIDVFIIAIFSFIMIFINTFIVLPLIDAAGTHMSEAQYEFFMLIIGTIPVLAIIFIFAILYYSLLTSLNMQATLGKKLMGIIVVNQYGERISFWHSFGRFFAYTLSKILYIGFIMAAFPSKLALHNYICGTKVVYKNKYLD
ncbi:RDD family protein [Bacillus subtilis]|uniref:RDD family protein n=1 Tax=Bacillus TaxID=1386 RepID=UPI0018CFA065|nr:RDD family protein [Bacillus subtilis]MBG9459620.1 membrane protein [Bacillus subtilis]MBG9490293.1 membrane protein [Bacillus subtilis]MBG9572591.1 membrane protein [Bacillus subtilis]MBR9949571.1 RDD family protein [Bacillus subtilis]UML52814.1 RDD family protein [Bacillus subtilis]